MGLDDLVPEDKSTSSSSSSSKSRQKENKVRIGSEPHKKVFSEDKWKTIKEFIIQEMGLKPSKVVNNYSAKERYEVLHEAALGVEGDKEPEELNNVSNNRCEICGTAVDQASVEIKGYEVCPQHPAAQVAVLIDEED